MHVLHVEDSDTYAEFVKRQLEDLGLKVDRYPSISKIESSDDYTVCLLDLELMETGGVETIKAFRNRYPYIPVVILSSNVDSRMKAEAARLGCHAYFDKGSNRTDTQMELLAAMKAAAASQAYTSTTSAAEAMESAAASLKYYSDLIAQRTNPS